MDIEDLAMCILDRLVSTPAERRRELATANGFVGHHVQEAYTAAQRRLRPHDVIAFDARDALAAFSDYAQALREGWSYLESQAYLVPDVRKPGAVVVGRRGLERHELLGTQRIDVRGPLNADRVTVDDSAAPTLLRSRMFIGSSAEGLPVAQALQLELDHDLETTIWSQGVFGLSGGTLETLVAAVHDFDFAALVLTPDDLLERRGTSRRAPRDNVLFEAGLFMGALGRNRTFMVASHDDELALPSDFAGITLARYRRRRDGNLQAAVGPVATNIRQAVAAVTGRKETDHGVHSDRTQESRDGSATEQQTLAELLVGIETLTTVLETSDEASHLRGDVGRIYGVLLEDVKGLRPRDRVVTTLSAPREAMSGVYQMTAGEARAGLAFMRSALVSAA